MNILITAVSGPTAIGIIKCLNNEGGVNLYGTDIYNSSIGKKWLKDVFVIPQHIHHDKYKQELKKIIIENNIDAIFPTLQEELLLVRDVAEEMNINAAIVQGYDLERLLNKKNIYEDLYKMGFGKFIPEYKVYKDSTKISGLIKKYFNTEKYVCFKRTEGHGGKGFFITALNKDDYINNLDKGVVFIDDFIDFCDCRNENGEMMISEYVDGEEISVDVLRHNKKNISIVTRVRTRVSTGIVIDGKTEKKDKIIDLASNIVNELDIEGFINMQFISNDNKTILIDLNPRFCGSQVMSLGAGVNFPRMILDIINGEELKPIIPRWNVTTKRYWESIFYDNKGSIL